jgi:hypothetical protein
MAGWSEWNLTIRSFEHARHTRLDLGPKRVPTSKKPMT